MENDDHDENDNTGFRSPNDYRNSNLLCGLDENSVGTEILNNSYRMVEIIGAGSFGTVYRAIDLFTGSVVACKRFRIPVTDEEGLPHHVIREIGLLKHLSKQPRSQHHLVRLLDVVIGESTDTLDQINIILDFFPTDMYNFIYQRDKDCSELKPMLGIAMQASGAVEYLHEMGVVHLDIKPCNILMDADGGRVRLADFGMARIRADSIPSNCAVVTNLYRPPELILNICGYNTRSTLHTDESKIDCWSLIATIYELFAATPLFGSTP